MKIITSHHGWASFSAIPKALEPAEFWFRVEAHTCGCEVVLVLDKIRVHHTTPTGVRLVDGRFVSRNSRKKYAAPTVAEALAGFTARKRRQLELLALHTERARCGLALALAQTTLPFEVNEAEDPECQPGQNKPLYRLGPNA